MPVFFRNSRLCDCSLGRSRLCLLSRSRRTFTSCSPPSPWVWSRTYPNPFAEGWDPTSSTSADPTGQRSNVKQPTNSPIMSQGRTLLLYSRNISQPLANHFSRFLDSNDLKVIDHSNSMCDPPCADYSCLGNPAFGDDAMEEVTESRRSFISGHSSFSFQTMMFCVLYLQGCTTWFDGEKILRDFFISGFIQIVKPVKPNIGFHSQARVHTSSHKTLLVPFLQLTFFCMAFATSLSRVTDNKHHPTDVLAGALIGMVFQWFNVVHIMGLFKDKSNDKAMNLPVIEEKNADRSRNYTKKPSLDRDETRSS